MAQFGYWGTWNDTWSIIQLMLDSKSFYCIRNLYYEKPEPHFLTTLNDSERAGLQVRPEIYLGSEQFTLNKPYFSLIEAGINKGKYLIDVSYGGPLLSLSLAGCYFTQDRMNLAPGMLSCQSTFWNPQPLSPFKPSPEIKRAYQGLVRLLKKHLVRIDLESEVKIWIGLDARDRFEQGNATIHAFGKEWNMPNLNQ